MAFCFLCKARVIWCSNYTRCENLSARKRHKLFSSSTNSWNKIMEFLRAVNQCPRLYWQTVAAICPPRCWQRIGIKRTTKFPSITTAIRSEFILRSTGLWTSRRRTSRISFFVGGGGVDFLKSVFTSLFFDVSENSNCSSDFSHVGIKIRAKKVTSSNHKTF